MSPMQCTDRTLRGPNSSSHPALDRCFGRSLLGSDKRDVFPLAMNTTARRSRPREENLAPVRCERKALTGPRGALGTRRSYRSNSSTETVQSGAGTSASVERARLKVMFAEGANPCGRGGVAEWLNAVLLKSTEPDEGSVRSNRTASLDYGFCTRKVSTAMSSWCLPRTISLRSAFAGCNASRMSSRSSARRSASSPARGSRFHSTRPSVK